MHWSCNYRCSYCFFDRHWADYSKRNVIKSCAEWCRLWERLRERYGRAFITITGGEPFAYPDFIEMLRRLSAVHWPINVSTNGSLHLEEFAKRIDHGKVSLSLSFHPQYIQIDEFMEKMRLLRRRGVALGCLNFVAYPPFLKDLPGFVERLRSIGESLKVIPFTGDYCGARYPGAYTAAEKKALGMDAPDEDWVQSKRRRGTLCMAGHRAALLLPDGKVTRCGQIGDSGIFGSFFDEDFRLLEGPTPCDAEICPCDEWKVIPDEKAPEAARSYLP